MKEAHNTEINFNSLKEWFKNAPDMGNEYLPKVVKLSQTYKEWLREYPQCYVCEAA